MDNRIVSVDIVDGELIVTYQDGSTESLGPVAELDPEELSAAVLKNAGDIVDLKRAVYALQTSVTALDTAVGAAETSIDSLEAEVSAIKNDLSDGTMTVNKAENADQLTATVGIEDNAPYLFRTSGGSNDIGDREDVRKIVGGTIAWNQQIQSSDKSGSNSGTDTRALNLRVQEGSNNIIIASQILSVGAFSAIINASFTGSNAVIKHSGAVRDIPFAYGLSIVTSHKYLVSLYFSGIDLSIEGGMSYDNFMFSDLTQDLGTSIADYVYSLETATAGAGVAWLKKHFPAQFNSGYQAYDAGSLQSVSGLTEHKMVGFNQWDEETELGAINHTTGEDTASTTALRSKNYTDIVGGSVYCFRQGANSIGFHVHWYDANKNFISYEEVYTGANINYKTVTAPSTARYMRFNLPNGYGTTYNHDICINLHWDGERDGEYEPYKTWSYPLDDSITLRGIPKVDASGNLYYDGDEYLPDGTVNRRYGLVDMGTLTWRYNETYTVFWADVPGVLPSVSSGKDNARCSKYTVVVTNEYGERDLPDKHMMANSSFAATSVYAVVVRDSAYTDAATFKTAMSGVYLIYEKNTPTTETALPYQETQIVDDFGTEEFVLADGAFPVPVGHETYYQNNLRAKLEMSPDSPDGDGLYVVQQESGENTYVPLASTATIQDILARLTALENASLENA